MFSENLAARYKTSGSLLCIGLDPDPQRIKSECGIDNVFEFNKHVIDHSHDLALCFKPQIAHYSAYGMEHTLLKTIDYIKTTTPDIPVILDAKRGDIGSTARMYALEAFQRYQADAVTVNPYLGFDSIEPFLKFASKGVIVLAKTSNPSATAIQDIPVDGMPLYQRVALNINSAAKNNPNLMFVVGGTYSHDLAKMRHLFPTKWMLIPGIGAQGADLQAVMHSGLSADASGLIISATRAIIYPAHAERSRYFECVRDAAVTLRDSIRRHTDTHAPL